MKKVYKEPQTALATLRRRSWRCNQAPATEENIAAEVWTCASADVLNQRRKRKRHSNKQLPTSLPTTSGDTHPILCKRNQNRFIAILVSFSENVRKIRKFHVTLQQKNTRAKI